MAQGLLLVDHGSRRAASNALLGEVAERLAARLPEGTLIEPAHMELAEPSVAAAFDRLVARGARRVIVVPYFLGPGRHATEDVPRLVAEAAARHPDVAHRVAQPLGPHALLEQLVLVRAGVRSGWTLYRQDDNGNVFPVESFDAFEAARAAQARFEARGHRQRYWIERR